MILSTLSINIIKRDGPVFTVPLTCQQEWFIGNFKYSEANTFPWHKPCGRAAPPSVLTTTQERKSKRRVLAWRRELPNPEAPWAWRSSAWLCASLGGSFCHNCILSLIHTSKGTCDEERPTVTQGCSGAKGAGIQALRSYAPIPPRNIPLP